MAARLAEARQGDTADLLAARHYDGDTSMTVAILDANPGLADHGPILPQGLVVVLPPPRPTTRPGLALWN